MKTSVICHHDTSVIANSSHDKRVILFSSHNLSPSGAAIGNQVWEELRRVDSNISQESFDFLSIALAVIAADTFILRSTSPTGFSRNIHLEVGVQQIDLWEGLKIHLEQTLLFLSGDKWRVSFLPNGKTAPKLSDRRRLRNLTSSHGVDSVSLFSGGLDSLIGAIDLLQEGYSPMLVSRSTQKDCSYQEKLKEAIKSKHHFSANDSPISEWATEDSTRTRSILFLALAACVSTSVCSRSKYERVSLILPENGLIAINPPLSTRRIGALSTRTAHPFYLQNIQHIFDQTGISVQIVNPYQFLTKGEALENCKDRDMIHQLATESVSCGKWKRSGVQCGRCIPCLIRRAAFHHAEIEDTTIYQSTTKFGKNDLVRTLESGNNHKDLSSLIYSLQAYDNDEVSKMTMKSGPLPVEPEIRNQYYDVVRRGRNELRRFLRSKNIRV